MKNLVSYDLETHKVQPGLLSPPIVCGSMATRSKDRSVVSALLTKPQAIEEARAWLTSNFTMTGMNIAYDFGCLAAADETLLPLIFQKYERGQVHDVGIALMLHLIALGCVDDGHLLDPRNGQPIKHPITGKQVKRVSLEVCVDICLNRSNAKQNDRFRLSYALLENLPHDQWPEDARQYPIDDAINGLEVAEWQVENCRNAIDLAAQCESAFALHLSSMWGIRTNPVKVAALEKTLLAKRAEDEAFAKAKGFMREDGSKDTKAIKQRVMDAYAGNPPKTDGGAPSTARETLESSGDEDLERLAELSNTERRLGTYLPVLQEAARVPLNVRPNVILANGRVSYDGIIQTMERKGPVRQCFESRPGTLLSSVDWTAAEMSSLAEVTWRAVGESKLGEVLNAGLDPHSLFAAEMTKQTYEDFVLKIKDGPLFDQAMKDLRQATKTADFGFNGMMGVATFVLQKRKEGFRICQLMRTAEKCSTEMIMEWKGRATQAPICKACALAGDNLKKFYLYRMWLEMPKYFNWVTIQLDHNPEITQLVSGRVRGGCSGPQAANSFFSGLVADAAKWVLRKMTRECYDVPSSPLFGSRIVLFQHDETLIEFPKDNLEAPERQAEIHREAGRIYWPNYPSRAEPAIMSVWFKDAATVRGPDGKLQVWAPKEAA